MGLNLRLSEREGELHSVSRAHLYLVMKLTDLPSCDNVQQIHIPRICAENGDAFRVYCRQCGNQWRVGKNWNGGPEKELWGELFFEDAVQPPHPLFYKLHAVNMEA